MATQEVLTSISSVIAVIEEVQAGSLTTGIETSVSDLLSALVTIVIKITVGIFDADFDAAVTLVTSVTNVATLTSVEIDIVVQVGEYIRLYKLQYYLQNNILCSAEVLSRLTVTTAEVATFALASLISSKGLIVSPISGDLTDDEFVEAADAQLDTNRANCAGMDQVASGISAILASTTTSFVCQDQFDDDCDLVTADASTLLTQLGLLVQISSLNIEDVTISSLAAEIITLIESITILSFEQEATLISLTATIQFTVFIYVSQISIIESAKLEIAGALAFPGATITIDQVEAVRSAY